MTAIGFVGLVRYPSDLRTPLVVSVLLGLGAITIAHGGWEGSPLGPAIRQALDGALQIFRNVHKIDPIVRLPIALGFAHAAWTAVDRVTSGDRGSSRHVQLLLILPACLLLTLGLPYLHNDARIYGWERLPDGVARGPRLPGRRTGTAEPRSSSPGPGSPARTGAGRWTSRCSRSGTTSRG